MIVLKHYHDIGYCGHFSKKNSSIKGFTIIFKRELPSFDNNFSMPKKQVGSKIIWQLKRRPTLTKKTFQMLMKKTHT